jgi:hypothetical protein
MIYQWTCDVPHNFTDQAELFADNVTSIWSGAVLSDWISVDGSYMGFVNYTNYSGLPQLNVSAPPMNPSTLPAYDSLRSEWATLNPTGTPLTAYTSTVPVPACPTSIAFETFDQNSPLPTLGISALPSSLQSSSSSTTSVSNSATSGVTHSSSLSTSGKIAVGVTVPLVVLLIAAGFYFFLHRKKTRQGSAAVNGERNVPELAINPARSGE